MRGRNHFLIMPDKTGVDLIINELAVKDGKLVLNMSDGEKFIVDRDELHAAIDGMSKPLTVVTKNDMFSLDKTSLTLHQRIFVKDDGDGKWAYYMVTGLDGDVPEFTKISDEDIWGSLFSDGVIAQVSKIGDLADLNADLNDPVTLVEAINNVLSKHLDLANKVGDVSKLTTTEKGTIVGAINELKVNITTNADGILEIKNEIGDVTKINLDDADKETIVDALNKIIAVQGTKLDSESVLPIIISYTGVLSDLNTTAKDNLVAAINEVLGKLNDEVARATKVEGDLTQLITGDKTDLVSAINSVKNDLTTEVNRATQAENNLQTAINNEVDRAQKAESDLQTAINNEVDRAKSAEADLQTAIDNEATTRAQNDGSLKFDSNLTVTDENGNSVSPANLTDAINAEVKRAMTKESDLQTAINNEVDRAKSAEADLQTAINNEVDRATNAEKSLQDAINAETNRAKSVEGDLNSLNTTNKDNLVGAINEVKADVDASNGDLSALKAIINDILAKSGKVLSGVTLNANEEYTIDISDLASINVVVAVYNEDGDKLNEEYDLFVEIDTTNKTVSIVSSVTITARIIITADISQLRV